MVIQIIIVIFILFVISRVYLRFRDKSITLVEFILWNLLWLGIGVVILLPQTTSLLAKILGVGRGVDAVIYLAIIILFYGLFRLYVKLEFIEHEITQIVRKLSLRDGEKNKK